MAFGRLRLSRNSRKTSSGSDNDTNGTTTPVDTEGQELTKTTSRGIIRTLTGSFSRSHRSSKSVAGKSEYPHLHKPFTKTNLEHQRILNAFEWNFGRSSICDSIYSGISPCASRRGSLDFDLPPSDLKDAHTRFNAEPSGDESDKGHGSGTETPQVTEVETIR
jgi:hypothetical protein